MVTAFLKAVIEAGQWIEANPMEAVEKMEKWTGVEKEVLYIYFSPGGHLTLDPTIKDDWIEALKFDHGVLEREKAIPPLDFAAWITEDYVKAAYADMGLDYAADKAEIVDPKAANNGLPNEVWHARDGISTYPTMKEFLQAVSAFNATGAKLNATYVYDKATGLKLFGKTAFFVKTAGGTYETFLRKPDADAFAAETGGSVIDLDTALGDFVTEG